MTRLAASSDSGIGTVSVLGRTHDALLGLDGQRDRDLLLRAVRVVPDPLSRERNLRLVVLLALDLLDVRRWTRRVSLACQRTDERRGDLQSGALMRSYERKW
jgi:hypothetical protein